MIELTFPLPRKRFGQPGERFDKSEAWSSNDRLHWTEEARRIKTFRVRAYAATQQWKAEHRNRTLQTPVRIVVHIPFDTARRRDCDNYQPVVKAVVDGLVSSGDPATGRVGGILPDDGPRYVEWQRPRCEVRDGPVRVVILEPGDPET